MTSHLTWFFNHTLKVGLPFDMYPAGPATFLPFEKDNKNHPY